MDKKDTFMLSLCQKAGKMVSGDLSVENSLQKGTLYLLIIASDASNNTKKKFQNKAFFYEVPVLVVGTKDELSHSIGKVNRSVFGITDLNFANKIAKDLEANNI